ncbi:carbamoyltransferase N-terminal domain-containing protein [Streptomyces sp. NPDC088747]|uniref:carbamoyltransferase N-terminal domain-containing protein n=1 Tax=Streptomyces sp. NPDC088747 TaxID=3365886 RepID=UPI00380692EC
MRPCAAGTATRSCPSRTAAADRTRRRAPATPVPPGPRRHHAGQASPTAEPSASKLTHHHLSHAYTTYCLSPHKEATVLVVDGGGNNNDTETYYTATPDGIERLGGNPPTRPRAGGIGATYEAFTNRLGRHEQEAGKTMALASNGDPSHYLAPLFVIVDTQVHGRLTCTHAFSIADLAKRTGFDFGPYDTRGLHELATNAAAYVQAETERATPA